MKKHHEIGDVRFEDDILVITIDHQTKRFPLGAVSQSLLRASEEERQSFEISPSGYGIHWPLLDEDISVDGLLDISHVPRGMVKAERHNAGSESIHHAEPRA